MTSAAACADRLDLVDAAYDHIAGPEAGELKGRFCPRCPIAAECFIAGMTGEAGVWGGTNIRQRSDHGAPHYHHRGNRITTRGRAA